MLRYDCVTNLLGNITCNTKEIARKMAEKGILNSKFEATQTDFLSEKYKIFVKISTLTGQILWYNFLLKSLIF